MAEITSPEALTTKRIQEKVQDAMANSMEGYSFLDIIADADLTPEQEEWASENLDWRVYFLDEPTFSDGFEAGGGDVSGLSSEIRLADDREEEII